jgi:REP element-mobilizing transposase RayT
LKKEELMIYRRRLPHWRLAGSVYFITWRLHPGQFELSPEERDIIAGAVKHFDDDRYDLLAYVVMHDHVHVLVKPAEKYGLAQLVHSWKSFTANRLQRHFNRYKCVWQDEYFDRIVRDEAELLEKALYIINNPFKVWPDIEEYQWVGGKLLEKAGTEARPTGTEARPTGTEARPTGHQDRPGYPEKLP